MRDLVIVVDVLQEDGGHHRVDGVAAIGEYLERGIGDDRELRRHHHALADRVRLRPLIETGVSRVGGNGDLCRTLSLQRRDEQQRRHDRNGDDGQTHGSPPHMTSGLNLSDQQYVEDGEILRAA